MRSDYSQWGIDRETFAAKEGVTPENLSMRIKKYGTPFQRKAKPTNWERIYGKTMRELSDELGMHPQSVYRRHYDKGNVYIESAWSRGNKGQFRINQKHYKHEPWLCEEHPDYMAWRNCELFEGMIKKP